MDQPAATALAAFVGVASAAITVVLKDFVFVRWHRRLDRTGEHEDVLRLYIAPLARASEKLIWRFAEIFLEDRHQFLKSATLPLVFNEYKRQSTLYRIGSLIGWIRAIELELNALPREAAGISSEFEATLNLVRRALADGPEVEVLRLRHLVRIWHLGDIPIDREQRIAANLERSLYSEAGDKLKHDASYLKNLSRDEKNRIVGVLSDIVCRDLGKKPPSDAVLSETVESAVAGLSYREALIYRDWQDAIGDSLLVKDEDSSRRYKIIGFDKFCDVLKTTDLWWEVFRESIIDIDFEVVDSTDYRATQLSALSSAVATMVKMLEKTNNGDLISKDALKVADELLSL